MMSLNTFNSMAAPDVLQLNMEIISKELNDLIVTEDGENGIAQQFSMRTVKTTSHSFVATAEQVHSHGDVPTYVSNNLYGQQQLCGTQNIPNLPFNRNSYLMVQQQQQQPAPVSQPQYSDKKSDYTIFANNLKTNQVTNRPILSSSHDSFSKSATAPTYEFHYLSPREEKDRKFSSFNNQGAYRKITKHHAKHIFPKTHNSYVNNEETQFDLSVLPFPDLDKESSNVRRVFELLRDLYFAITETLMSSEEDLGSQFEETFVSLSSKKFTMPSTLNVQNQVKQACRKLTIFTYEMQRILSNIKVYDGELHAECGLYLNQLQQFLNQLEMYKSVVMEHRNGKFLREDVNAHAERLALLLEYTNRQIREVNIRILATDWYIGVKYRGDIHINAVQFNAEAPRKSQIGIINEILQMCNTAEAELSINYKTTTTTPTTAAAAAVTAETFQPETSYNSTKQLLFNKEMANVQPLLFRNNNIFDIYKPNQTKRSTATATATTGGQPIRQPVFYIG